VSPGNVTIESMQHEPHDDQIISEIRAGNIERFELLVERYKAHVFSIVSAHVPRDRVEELAQDVFIRAFNALGNLRERAKFEHWIAKIAVRCCYDFWRCERRKREVPLSSLSPQNRAWLEDFRAQDLAARSEERSSWEGARALLDEAFLFLSAPERTIITLVEIQGNSMAQAAEILGWSTVNVKVRAHRARKKLRAVLQQILYGGKV